MVKIRFNTVTKTKMTEQQEQKEQNKKIEGVPEGYELVALRQVAWGEDYLDFYGHIRRWALRNKSEHHYPVLARIAKPKQNVLIAEVKVTPEEAALIRINTLKVLIPDMVGSYAKPADLWRIEEREV